VERMKVPIDTKSKNNFEKAKIIEKKPKLLRKLLNYYEE